MKIKIGLLFAVFTIGVLACKSNTSKKGSTAEPDRSSVLPSFNEGKAKDSIIDFVEAVTTEGGPEYIAPNDRIVCFDNDGTLWTEQPLPNQIYFTLDRIRALAKTDKHLQEQQPFKAVIENDTAAMSKFTAADVITLAAKADAIDKVEDFNAVVQDWFKVAKHPRYERSFDQVVYQPMLELLDYLRAHDFRIFIVSGGSVEFMRAFSSKVYGIETQNVIGSRMKLEVEGDADSMRVRRLAEFAFNDDKKGKVLSIEEFIGRKPIMVVGNSDGDLAMMEYAFNQKRKTLMVYVKHDDADREYFYDAHVLAGKLEQGEKVALENNWTIISMKKDWKTVFPF